jgi:hypothetical protein
VAKNGEFRMRKVGFGVLIKVVYEYVLKNAL